ncbi:hypothetical protein MCAP1_002943 [Malassezia caprae]|uniref:HOOK N-terminal domain-containing protein n=1 Tax=Malassezia caprae TaxID=1381934 RepID=A0AAF0IX72_9BASI|nr:hypothetical protein MCAP1_002943 [Malassezia caprae]
MAATAAPPVSTQLSALTAWVQAVCVEHTVDTPSDLGDGAALFEVLAGVYTEELGVESQRLPDIDIQAAAQSPPSQEELVKVLRLVVGLVVRSEDNNEHVNAMQSLVYDDQVTMMNIVETVLADFAQIPKEDAQDAATVSPVAPDAAQEIEALQRDLERANERCQTQHERLVAVEVELQRVQDEHQQLDQLVTSLRAAERERDTLRDKQDEWRHMAELMKKQDRQLDTLRTRAEEAAELRRQVRELESANTELSNSAGVAAERSASDVMDKHRSAIRASERRLTELQEAHETVCKERDELESRCEKLEEQRRTDQEQLQTLLERVQSMELEQGMHSVSLAEEISETSSAMPRQANASVDPRQADLDTVRPSSSAHAILAAALSDTKTMQEQLAGD